MSHILVTRKLPAAVISKLEAIGTLDVYAGEGAMPPEELRARGSFADGLISVLTDAVDRAVIDAAPRLRVVANIAVGYNNIDVPYARSRGVVVTNTPDVLTDSVADFTWGMILALTRRIVEGDRLVRRGAWTGWAFDFMLGSEMTGKRLGLIGLGRIGRAVAARAQAFGARVAYTSRREVEVLAPAARAGTASLHAAPHDRVGPHEAWERLSLDRLLNTSDVVSLHVPLTPDTTHLIDKRALARMKRSAYLINTSRGPVVDEQALAWALGEHLIAGAALDVYEYEPRVQADLLQLENVILVPHLGSATTETRTAMADLAVANVIAVLGGQAPLTPVP